MTSDAPLCVAPRYGTRRSTFGLSWTKTTQTLECSMTFLPQTGEQAHFETLRKASHWHCLRWPLHILPPPERPGRHPAATRVVVLCSPHESTNACLPAFFSTSSLRARTGKTERITIPPIVVTKTQASLLLVAALHHICMDWHCIHSSSASSPCCLAAPCGASPTVVLQSYSAVLQSSPFALFSFISIPSPTNKACNPISARPHLIDSLTHHSLPLAPHAHIHTGRRRPVEEGMTSPPRVRRVLTRSKYRDAISFLSIHHPSREPRRARQQDKASSRLSHAHRGRPPLPPSSSSSTFFTASPSSFSSSFSGTDEDDEDFFPPPPVLVRQHAYIVFSSDVDSYLEIRMLHYTGHLMRRQDKKFNPNIYGYGRSAGHGGLSLW